MTRQYKLSEAGRARIVASNKGKSLSSQHKSKIRDGVNRHIEDGSWRSIKYGKDSLHWKGGISSLQELIRKSTRYSNWSNSVYTRDGGNCRLCNKHGFRNEMIAHHSKMFCSLFREFLAKHPDKNPIDDKYELLMLSFEDKLLWNVEDGVLLCIDCHGSIHNCVGGHSSDLSFNEEKFGV